MNDKYGVEILESDIVALDCPQFSTKKIIFRAVLEEQELHVLDLALEQLDGMRGFLCAPLCAFSPDDLEILGQTK